MDDGVIDQTVARSAKDIHADFLELAPLHLPHLRSSRYPGDVIAVPMESFVAADRLIIGRVYEQVNGLHAILSAPGSARAKSSALHKFLESEDFNQLRADLRALGYASLAGGREPDRATAKAVHDIRGGALSVLLLRLEMARQVPLKKDDLRTLFTLVRDHGKIMRSAVVDLDAAARQRDLAPQSHHVRMLIEKWHEVALGRMSDGGEVRLFIDSRFDGAVSECCLESAAIDRVFYNLLANAMRHNAGDRLDLLIFEIPAAPGENLRFVLRNAVSAADAQRLRALATDQKDSLALGRLFAPGVSTTGSGLGLSIVADFVTQAYGLRNEQEAVRLGYCGARLLKGEFVVWFHWPIARGDLGKRATSDAAQEVPPDLERPQGPPAP